MLRIEKFTRKLQKQKNLQSRKKEYKQIILYDMKNSTCLLESLCLNHLCPESFFGVWVFFWVWDLLLFFSWTTGIPPWLWWGQGTICGICNPTNPKARPGRSINRKNNLWCCLKKHSESPSATSLSGFTNTPSVLFTLMTRNGSIGGTPLTPHKRCASPHLKYFCTFWTENGKEQLCHWCTEGVHWVLDAHGCSNETETPKIQVPVEKREE